jgi:hypothetical protein
MIDDTDRMHVVAQRQLGSGGSHGGSSRRGGVMSADQEYSGDYGYDLAHEVHAALHAIPRPRGASPVGVSAVPFAAMDAHGDLGYDSALESGS